MSEPRVLVVGKRRGLVDALARAGIPFVVSDDLERPPRGRFTHVLAGGEGSVVPAARLRRLVGARTAPDTIVLRCHDKLLMKRHLHARGIPMTAFLAGEDESDPRVIADRLGFPVVVKPRASSGGRGLRLVLDADELARTDRAGRLLERFVNAPEASVESFVSGGNVLFENVTRYVEKGHVNVVPGDLGSTMEREVRALSARVIATLGIQWGMTHLETYLTPEGPLFGEIALRPPGGYIMDCIRLAYGFDPWDAFVAIELDRPFGFPPGPLAVSGSMLFHPGAGRVRAVTGLSAVRKDPAVVRAKVRVKKNAVIPPRVGFGQEVGHVLLRCESEDALADAIERIKKTFRIELEPA